MDIYADWPDKRLSPVTYTIIGVFLLYWRRVYIMANIDTITSMHKIIGHLDLGEDVCLRRQRLKSLKLITKV